MTQSAVLSPRRITGLGWIRDLPDVRDYRFATPQAPGEPLPAQFSLRAQCPPVYDQGQLGSCTANAIAAAVQIERRKQTLTPDFVPSRLFVYYGERVIERSVRQDAGAQIRDGFKVIAKAGAPDETLWPYDISRFARKPPAKAYTAAKLDVALQYLAVDQTASAIKQAILAGYAVVFGFTVYQSFESAAVAKSGVVPLPAPHESVLGGHAVLLVGWDDTRPGQPFEVRNSWGPSWGDQGYCWMPSAYVLNPHLSSDFWCVQSLGPAK